MFMGCCEFSDLRTVEEWFKMSVECLTLRISKKKRVKPLYTFKFTNFEFQTFETTSNSRVSRIFVRPLKIGSLGLMYPIFGGNLALWKEVLLWLVCCLFFFLLCLLVVSVSLFTCVGA